jgi:glycine betaine/proline transport system substrate-binding protein
VDVFLGNWIPAQNAAIKPYLDSGEIEQVAVNLEGTKYTLATPTYAWEAGLKSYADIHKFADELDEKIYGIEPGNEGNGYLVSLTEENKFDLKTSRSSKARSRACSRRSLAPMTRKSLSCSSAGNRTR